MKNNKTDFELDFDQVWIDFLEGTLDENLMPDLKTLLKISPTSRRTLFRLEVLKELIQIIDPAPDELLERWDQKQTKANIMNAIYDLENQKSSIARP